MTARAAMGSILDLVGERLASNGPATIEELAKALDANSWSVRSVLYRCRGTRFEVLWERKTGRRGGPEQVWGLVGALGVGREAALRLVAETRRLTAEQDRLRGKEDDANVDRWFEMLEVLAGLAPRLAIHLEQAVAAAEKRGADETLPTAANTVADCRM